jgi:NADH:ubiquinone oxidoreductase subunit C
MSDAPTVPSHPTLPLLKKAFPNVSFLVANYRDQVTVVVPKEHLHAVARFLRDDPACAYSFLSDVVGVDYLDYPAPQPRSPAAQGLSAARPRRARVLPDDHAPEHLIAAVADNAACVPPGDPRHITLRPTTRHS